MKILQQIGIFVFVMGLVLFLVIPFIGTYTIDESIVRQETKQEHQEIMAQILAPMYGQTYSSNFSFLNAFGQNFDGHNQILKNQSLWDQVIWDDYSFVLAKATVSSPMRNNPFLYLFLSIGLTVLGGLLYIIPSYSGETEGVKNNGIFHSSLKSRGLLGMVTGSFLILFYIILYWFPAYSVNLVWMVEPISQALSGMELVNGFCMDLCTLWRFW